MSATLVRSSSTSQPSLALTTGLNDYKELAPVEWSEETELKGTEKEPPASFPNYLPVWDEKR